jgi:hypothetical protein
VTLWFLSLTLSLEWRNKYLVALIKMGGKRKFSMIWGGLKHSEGCAQAPGSLSGARGQFFDQWIGELLIEVAQCGLPRAEVFAVDRVPGI